MARIFTIDAIEGNSNLGNPVFSNFGKMQNYHYIALSPSKEERMPQRGPDPEPALDKENMQFKVKKPAEREVGGANGSQSISIQERRQQIHDVLSAYDNQMANAKHHQAKRVGEMRGQARAKEATGGLAAETPGGGKGSEETAVPTAVGAPSSRFL